MWNLEWCYFSLSFTCSCLFLWPSPYFKGTAMWNWFNWIFYALIQVNWNLLSWCFESSQPQRITSRQNTNFILSPNCSFHKSLYHKSYVFSACLYSAGTQHGNLHPAGWPILFCGPTQEPVLAAANTEKTWERFWKKCRWMGWKGRN